MLANYFINQLNNPRYERKYVFPVEYVQQLKQQIFLDQLGFREIYYQRQVNNIYLDDHANSLYWQNEVGNAQRVKIRVRWYGEKINQPVQLEVKCKQGLLGYKYVEPIALKIQNGSNYQELSQSIAKKTRDEYLATLLPSLHPTLSNQYQRQYFQSGDKQIRVTLDTHLHFSGIKNIQTAFLTNHNASRTHGMSVLEIKYDPELEDEVAGLNGRLPLSLTKFSKYVVGLERV